PEGDYEMVAGYLLATLGTVPEERETVELDGLRFTILQASPSRIEAVRIRKL
ncbi:MAG: transporter associated domain-containing protein, partial [Bacteroidota bacterium]